MIRNILAVIAGVIIGSAVNMGFVLINLAIYPLPEGVEFSDTQAMQAYFATLPASAFVIVWLAHAGGTLAGALAAAWIARSGKFFCATIIGVCFLLGGILNLLQLPLPPLFAVVDLLSYLPAAWLGYWLVKRRSGPNAIDQAT